MSALTNSHFVELLSQNKYHEIVASVNDSQLNLYSHEIVNIYAVALFKTDQFVDLEPILLYLEPFLSSDPNFLSLCGASFRRLGKYSDATRYLESALKMNPDSLDIKNNLSNLLIDLGEYKRAEEFLNSILIASPDHADAIINLHRLQVKKKESISNQSSSDISVSTHFQLQDPLTLAFSEEEISRTFAKIKPSDDPISKTLLANISPKNSVELAGESIALSRKYIQEGLFKDALKLCSNSLRTLGPKAEIYECASDAFVGLKLFHQAEVSLLISYILGSKTSKTLLNLVTFSSLRYDTQLSSHILNQAELIDPSNPHIPKFIEMLNSSSNENKKSFSFEDWIIGNEKSN